MNTAEKIMKKKGVIKAELDKALPKTQSDALWREATAKLDGLLARYSALPKGVHIHTDSRILPSAAIYLTVKETVGPEKAYRAPEADGAAGDAGPVRQNLGPDDEKAVRLRKRLSKCVLSKEKRRIPDGYYRLSVLPDLRGAGLPRTHKDLLRKRRTALRPPAGAALRADRDAWQRGRTL